MDYRDIGNGKGIVTMKNGTRLAVPMWDPFIGCHIAIEGEGDSLIERELEDRVTASSRCINVGANIGYFSILLARLCGPSGQVFCFEPNPKNVDLLTFNFCLNRLHERAHIYRAAVASTRGTAKFIVPRDYSDGWIVPDDHEKHAAQPRFAESGLMNWQGLAYRDAEIIEVPVVTLDYVLGGAGVFDFLLCDAEGFDCDVIIGAARLIRNSPGLTIVFEWDAAMFEEHFKPAALIAVFGLLRDAGYRTFHRDQDSW